MGTRIIILAAGLLAGSLACAAEGGPAAPKPPAPVASLSAVPADGSGSYRLTLVGLGGRGEPVLVYLDVRAGQVAAAAGRGIVEFDEAFMPAEVKDLALADGRLRGRFVITVPGLHHWRGLWFKQEDKTRLPPTAVPPRGSLAVQVDVPMEGRQGAGTYTATRTLASRKGPESVEGVARLVREPVPAMGQTAQVHLYLPFALGPTYAFPQVSLIADLAGGRSTRILATWAIDGHHHHVEPILVTGELVLTGGLLKGRVELRPALKEKKSGESDPATLEPLTLQIANSVIGRWTFGNVKVAAKDRSWESACAGRRRSGFWPIPLEMPENRWTWQHDRPADSELAAQAAEEALRPVLEGVPGERGSWTWRRLVKGGAVHSARPVNFDFREVPGAAGYRFTAQPKGGSAKSVTLEKPWKPLTELWPALPPGGCPVTFEALDAAGKVLSTEFKMGILDKETGQPAAKALTSIVLGRKPAFAGPYAKAPRGLRAAALEAGRWTCEGPAYPRASAMNLQGTFDVGGEASSSWLYAGHIWGCLARRALAPTPDERADAEETLDLFLDSLALNQAAAKPEGVFYAYKGSTPLARFGGEAALDAWVETGDERGKAMALRLGAGLAAIQAPDGGWPVKGWGFFGWKQGFLEWGAAELLYILGRIHRDCGTDQFLQAENKAYRHVMETQVKGMFWPVSVHHSLTWGYPVVPHAQAAMYFIRYLVELAPPENRDVALAEQLALWCEDADVDWGRASAGPQETGPIRPMVSRGDRANSDPIVNTSLMALVCLDLHRATGKRLWLAKADALMTACIQAQDPASGLPNADMAPQVSRADYQNHFSLGWLAKNLREYEVRRAAIQPPFAVGAGEGKP